VDVSSNQYRFLATEIAHKDYSPCVVEVAATGDGADAETHAGQEFAYVLEGRVRFVCDGYAPVVLEPGDSVYFDAVQAHRYLTIEGAPARILCVYSHPAANPHLSPSSALAGGRGRADRATARAHEGA
jgi:mannose-6-phosphate isomerase-like protein (cupin superfamily)